jgi:hypothetical protein
MSSRRFSSRTRAHARAQIVGDLDVRVDDATARRVGDGRPHPLSRAGGGFAGGPRTARGALGHDQTGDRAVVERREDVLGAVRDGGLLVRWMDVEPVVDVGYPADREGEVVRVDDEGPAARAADVVEGRERREDERAPPWPPSASRTTTPTRSRASRPGNTSAMVPGRPSTRMSNVELASSSLVCMAEVSSTALRSSVPGGDLRRSVHIPGRGCRLRSG